MGKRTAIEADMVDHQTHDHAPRSVPMTSTSSSLLNSPDPVRSVLVSPVPCAWQHIPDQNVEPHGACHMRVRTASRIKTTQPSRVQRDDVFTTITHTLDDDSVLDDDSDPMTELSMTLPPLVAPRPRRVVSPDLIFQSSRPSHYHSEPEKNETLPDPEAMHSMTIRRRAFRPIGAGRPDVDITSPPPRAMNPVVLDARFKNMQRLDLALDAQEAPLQPFHRPCPQRRVPSVGVHGVPVVPVAKIVPLDRDHMLTTANSV